MQRRFKIDLAQSMASYTHTGLGRGRNAARRYSKHGWILRRTLCSRYDGEWTLSRRCILPLYVV